MATYQDVDNILNSSYGKYRGVLYAGIYQCVAWGAWFSGQIGGPTFLPTPSPDPNRDGGARDIYEQFPASLRAFYDRIPNTQTFVPRKGDLCIWGAMPKNPYGHISVATGEGDTSTFWSADQNFVYKQPVTRTQHNYSYFLGVLRPKNLTGGTMAETVQQVEQRLLHGPGGIDEWIVKYAGLSDQFYAAKTQIQSQQDQIAKLTADLATAQANDASDAAKIASLEEKIKNVPSGPHQDAAQEVADQLKPVVGFWARVLKFLRS